MNLYIINKNKKNNRKKNSISFLANKKIKTENKTVNNIKIHKSNSYDKNNKINHLEKLFFEIKDKNNNMIQRPIKKEKISWFSYILYLVLFKRNNSKIKFFENFRAHTLSEENLMQNKCDIYKLLEYCNLKRIN